MWRIAPSVALVVLCQLLVVSASAQDFWQATGGPEGGIIETLGRGSGGDLLAASRWSGRAYRSTDNGLTWTRIGLDVSPGWITDFATGSQGTLFAAGSCGDVCTERSGVYRSTDGGVTWGQVGLAGQDVISVYVSTAGQIFASGLAGENGAIYRSADGGTSWTSVGTTGGNLINNFTETTDGSLFAAGNGSGIWMSSDAGVTWTKAAFPCGPSCQASSGANIQGVVSDSAGNLYVGSEPEGLFASTDKGQSWTAVAGMSNPDDANKSVAVLQLSISETDEIAAWVISNDPDLLGGDFTAPDIFSSGLALSSDGGVTWSDVSNSEIKRDYSIQDTVFGANGHLFIASGYRGVQMTADGGENWTSRNDGIIETTVGAIDTAPNGLVFAAADSGLFRSPDAGLSWQPLDITGPFTVDRENVLYVASATVIGIGGESYIYKSTDGGNSFERLDSSGDLLSELNSWFTLLGTNATGDIFVSVFDNYPVDGDVSGLYRSDDGGATWLRADQGLGIDRINELAFAPNGTMFAAGQVFQPQFGTKLFRSTDDGNSWTEVTSFDLGENEVYDMAVHEDCTLFVATVGLHRSDDCGETWIDITEGLGKSVQERTTSSHEQSVYSVFVTPDGDLYAGYYRSGVSVSTDMGMTWTAVDEGFPDLETEIAYSMGLANGFLLAGTASNGVYRSVERVTSAPTPSLEIVWPASGMTLPSQGATVKVAVENFVFDCDNIGGTPVLGNGHWGVRVDGVLDSISCTPTAELTNALSPGEHTIEVELMTNDHQLLDPPVKASVDVQVDAGSVTYTPASVVTGVARTSGAGGSFFKTSLWITAPEGASVLRLEFVPAPGQPAADFPSVSLTVGVNESFAFGDALKNAFGVTEGTFGNIVVSVAEGSVKPKISARTFNDQSENGKGTFGQFIPEIELVQQAVKRSPFNGSDIRLDGLSASSAFRSNVGIVNLDLTGTLSATIQILDASSMPVGDPIPVQVPPGSLVQTNAVGASLGLDTFSVSVSADGPFSAYASKLDNTTSDSIFILDSASSEMSQWIDGVGSVQGAGGTFFKSELSLTNRSGADATVTVSLVERGATTPTATVDLDLVAGESRLYGNSVNELFDLDGVAGAFWISGPSGISAWARTYNDLTESGGEGSFGQFIPAFDSTDLVGLSGAIIPGLSQNAKFRTNAGFVNVGLVDASVTVSVWSSGGQQLGEKGYFVPAGTAVFISQIVADVGVDSLSDGYVRLMPSTGDAVYGWASSVDNVSTDQTFFRPFNLD